MSRTTNWRTFALGQHQGRIPVRPPAGFVKRNGGAVRANIARLDAKLTAAKIDKADNRKGVHSTARPALPLDRVKTCKCAQVNSCPACSVQSAPQPKLTPMEYLRVMPGLHESNPEHTRHKDWLSENVDDYSVIIPTARQDCIGAKWCRVCDASIHTCTCPRRTRQGIEPSRRMDRFPGTALDLAIA